MPDDIKQLCRLADISSKSLLLQVVRQQDPQKMSALIERITSAGGATRQELRAEKAKPKPGRPRHYVFAYRPKTKHFDLKLKFRKTDVEREEVISALEAIIRDLRAES
jgi:ParB family chromosome partitioning protein